MLSAMLDNKFLFVGAPENTCTVFKIVEIPYQLLEMYTLLINNQISADCNLNGRFTAAILMTGYRMIPRVANAPPFSFPSLPLSFSLLSPPRHVAASKAT